MLDAERVCSKADATLPLQDASGIHHRVLPPVTAVFYRPVRIGEIVQRIEEILRQPRLA
jgi:hypothetical protein